MLLAGDELGHTQQGNNNTYCQDNELSWIDWSLAEENRLLLDFVRRLLAFRKRHRSFRRRRFFKGGSVGAQVTKDITWLNPEAEELTDEEWDHAYARALGVLLAGGAMQEYDERRQPIHDDDFLLLLNAHHEAMAFAWPAPPSGPIWRLLLDTARPEFGASSETCVYRRGDAPYRVEALTCVLFSSAKMERL
jgi:glycogen operon protein